MNRFFRVFRLMRIKIFKKILIYLRIGFGNLETLRDIALGLLINGFYGIFNDGKMFSYIITIVSVLAIIATNYRIRRNK
ncbi:hypothetical protein BKH46_08720 [Helicobacter sp. 12S02634-8]|nr:hypothetical protein BKH46_08720 [Helicobacter sp. 12S02634-8]